MRSLSSSIAIALRLAYARRAHRAVSPVTPVKRGQGGQSARRLGSDAPRLRAYLYRPAGGEIVKELLKIRGRKILIVILVDLHHGRIAASAQTLDLDPGKQAVLCDLALLANPPAEDLL